MLLGVIVAAGVGLFAGYGEMMIHSSPMSNDHCAPVALFALFLALILLSVPLGLIRRRWALSPAELGLVYIMALAAAAVPTRGFASFIGPVVTGAQYYAAPENGWERLILPHIRHLTWLMPQGAATVDHYYAGLPKGAPIPWRAWVAPVFWWWAFCMALSFVMVCVAVILRRQWMANERLVYPLVQAPLELIRHGEDSGKPSIFRSRLLWLGMMVPCLLFSMNGLARYFPAYLSSIRLRTSVALFGKIAKVRVSFSPISLGLLYFVRSDVLMGLWIFPLVVQVIYGYLRYIGFAPMQPKLGIWSYDTIRAFTGSGVMLVYVVHFLYMARRHIFGVLKTAFGRSGGASDKGEIMSYRTAVWGILLGGAFLAMWLHAAGMSWWQAVVYLVFAFIIYLALTRVVAEAGLPVAQPPAVAGDMMVGVFGSSSFSKANLAAFGFTYPFHAEMRCNVMTHAANALKTGHETIRGGRRMLLVAIMVAVCLGFLGAMALQIYFPYTEGGANLDRFTFVTCAKYSWQDAQKRIESPMGPVWKGYPLMAIGGSAMAALLFAIHRFPGFPIHPAGLLISFQWTGFVLWFSALVIWIVKGLMLKWGGPGLYRGFRPFFLGLIVGEVLTAGVWTGVDIIVGEGGTKLTSFF